MKREELIAYDRWVTKICVVMPNITYEECADLYLAEHPLPPAEGAKKVQWSGYGELGNISQKPPQPTAEGAEEFLKQNHISGADFVYTTGFKNMVALVEQFATLHARKMALENLEEFIKNLSPGKIQAISFMIAEGNYQTAIKIQKELTNLKSKEQ